MTDNRRILVSLCLHIHQPTGNFEHVMEDAYRRCYHPLLQALSATGVPCGLHISGCLLDWLESTHSEYLELLGDYLDSTGSEMLTSGYYEPILPILPPGDARMQITRFSERLKALGGGLPRGLWLTERVWEPSLPRLLDQSHVQWVVVDDRHLQLAGVDSGETWRPALTEDGGSVVALMPSSKRLRYLIPFHSVEEVREELDRQRNQGVELAFYGDDGEKFGVWPGTYDLCYGRGWLARFLEMVSATPWIDLAKPTDALKAVRPQGPVYVPTASYREMGEWTLPVAERRRQRALAGAHREELEEHFREGFWRSFLTRYPESGELHKLALLLQPSVAKGEDREALLSLWRSQCNCSYWHGVFGGIYLPHLREAVWTELLKACRSTLEAPLALEKDLDFDGRRELLLQGGSLHALLRPGSGLTATALAWIGGEVPRPLGHVLSRRVEAYHDLVREPDEEEGDGARTIHSDVQALEPGLGELITEDSWRRCLFSDLLLPADASVDLWASGDAAVTAFQQAECRWSWSIEGSRAEVEATIRRGSLIIAKRLLLDLDDGTVRLESSLQGGEPGTLFGVEVSLNMLTGSSPDRFLSLDGDQRRPLGNAGRGEATVALVADLWRGVQVEMEAASPVDFWFSPLYSVNRSERGYEKVFQGSALMPVRPVDGEGRCVIRLAMRIGEADGR